jgi:hypothetical protein
LKDCKSYNNDIYCPGKASRPSAWDNDSPFSNCIEPNSTNKWSSLNVHWNTAL